MQRTGLDQTNGRGLQPRLRITGRIGHCPIGRRGSRHGSGIVEDASIDIRLFQGVRAGVSSGINSARQHSSNRITFDGNATNRVDHGQPGQGHVAGIGYRKGVGDGIARISDVNGGYRILMQCARLH